MAIETRYVVTHKGEEKLVTADKKEADKYDKMLSVADNLAEFIEQQGLSIEDNTLEDLTIMLAKNKEDIQTLLKGKPLGKTL